MCLAPIETFLKKPYNNSKIRWKILQIADLESGKPKIASLYQDSTIWKIGKTQVAEYDKNDVDTGIHVFVTRQEAINHIGDELGSSEVIAKVEVSGFIAGGVWDSDETPNEVWKKAKLVEIYTQSGRHPITDLKKYAERLYNREYRF